MFEALYRNSLLIKETSLVFCFLFFEQTCHTFVQIDHDGLAALDDILRSRLIIHVLAVSCLGVRFSIAPQVLTAQ